MKFDKYKAFPYPVLRPNSDDYKESEFQATVDFTIVEKAIKAEIRFALSCEEIKNAIDLGVAEYICIVSCRDTYYQKIIKSNNATIDAEFDIGVLRGEVRVDPYVVATKNIPDFISSDINPEFGSGPFNFLEGDVLAQDETQVFYIDRDLFKSVTSVFDLVANKELQDDIWTVSYDQNHIPIQVSLKLKESIDNARNDPKKRIILKNSIYFAAVMQAIQKLKDPAENFEGKKWADIIKKQAHNKNIDLDNHDAYLIAEHLMERPIIQLESHVFCGGNP